MLTMIDTNSDLFTDLSSEQASVLTGGYLLKNISGSGQEFVTLGRTAGFNPQTLSNGNELEIPARENYILYIEQIGSNDKEFTPKLFNVEDTGGRYRFNTENGKTIIQPF